VDQAWKENQAHDFPIQHHCQRAWLIQSKNPRNGNQSVTALANRLDFERIAPRHSVLEVGKWIEGVRDCGKRSRRSTGRQLELAAGTPSISASDFGFPSSAFQDAAEA